MLLKNVLKRHSKHWAASLLTGTVMIAALCLSLALTGCSKNNVVVEPITLRQIDGRLKRDLRIPLCEIFLGDTTVSAESLQASINCWKAAFQSARSRYYGLRRAVIVREAAAAKAAAARPRQ